MEIDVNEVMTAYKNRLSDVTHENVLLTAQCQALVKRSEDLENRIARLESSGVDGEAGKSDSAEN